MSNYNTLRGVILLCLTNDIVSLKMHDSVVNILLQVKTVSDIYLYKAPIT